MLLLLYRGELEICWNILKESSLFKNEIKAIFIIIFLSSCSLFEEVEVPLDGERENVFEIDEKKLIKSFVKVYLPKPELVEDWNQNNQNKSNHLFHFSSNQSIEKKWEINIGEGEGGIGPYIISPIVYKNIIYTVGDIIMIINNPLPSRVANSLRRPLLPVVWVIRGCAALQMAYMICLLSGF